MELRKFNAVSPVRPLGLAFGCAALVAASAIAGQWVLNVHLGFPRLRGIGLVGPTISFLVTGVLVYILRFRALQRRKARLARAQIVADCNHEIRNALQCMVGLNYPQESVVVIEAAVKRIDGALRDLLPHLEDDDADGDGKAPRWEIHEGRPKVKDQFH
jgi:hypothetical protein